MGGFNLPPGCSVSDIPGNRPHELAEEARWDDIYAKFPWLTRLSNGERIHRSASDLHDMIVKLCDHVYETGIKEGEARAGEVLAERELDEIEETFDKLGEDVTASLRCDAHKEH